MFSRVSYVPHGPFEFYYCHLPDKSRITNYVKTYFTQTIGSIDMHFRFLKSILQNYTEISTTKFEAAKQEMEEICNKRNLVQEELLKREKVHQQVNYYFFESQNNFYYIGAITYVKKNNQLF